MRPAAYRDPPRRAGGEGALLGGLFVRAAEMRVLEIEPELFGLFGFDRHFICQTVIRDQDFLV